MANANPPARVPIFAAADSPPSPPPLASVAAAAPTTSSVVPCVTLPLTACSTVCVSTTAVRPPPDVTVTVAVCRPVRHAQPSSLSV